MLVYRCKKTDHICEQVQEAEVLQYSLPEGALASAQESLQESLSLKKKAELKKYFGEKLRSL